VSVVPDRVTGEAVLYARDGCSPCFALKRLATRSARRHGVRLRVVDVDSDPALRERFGREVPVLELPGGVRLQGRASARDVDDAFRRAAGGRAPSWLQRLFGLDAGAARKRTRGGQQA